MNIEDLKNIGQKLLKIAAKYRFTPDAKKVIKVGASGDKTFLLDKKAEETIISHLESMDKSFHITTEEYGYKKINKKSKLKDQNNGIKEELYVLIDPIDGSKNAVSGLPVFCTSIAVAKRNKIGDIFLSYVINLTSGDEFWAESDKGAYLNGKRIKTQIEDDINVVLYEATKPKIDLPRILPLLSLSNKSRCLGSIALDLAYLSYGSASAFVSPSPSRSFDFGGGWLLVKEAGGILTDLNGEGLEKLEFSIKRSTPILASANEKIHEKVLKALRIR